MQRMTRLLSSTAAAPGLRSIESSRLRSRNERWFASLILLLRAYSKLVHFDRYLARQAFASLHNEVGTYPVARTPAQPDYTDQVCRAVDMARIWYWKEVLCLQRSATTVCLLRRVGVPAQMVVGVQQTPFKSHAWVEVEGHVVNDKPYMRDLYTVLDVC